MVLSKARTQVRRSALGKTLGKTFNGHWFALWHDPSQPAEDLILLIYEGPEASSPMGVISLQKSRYVVEPPKTPRKGYSHCMRITAGGATRQQTRSAAYNPVYPVCGASFAGLG